MSLPALALLPSVALASDFSGLVPVLFLQAAVLAWPLLLPLFYLRPRRNKVQSWFLFALLCYGSIGVAAVPESFYTNIASWFPYDEQGFSWPMAASVGKQAVAFLFCLWFLPRYRALLREPEPAQAR
jgi:hypothetical protein